MQDRLDKIVNKSGKKVLTINCKKTKYMVVSKRKEAQQARDELEVTKPNKCRDLNIRDVF